MTAACTICCACAVALGRARAGAFKRSRARAHTRTIGRAASSANSVPRRSDSGSDESESVCSSDELASSGVL